MPKIFDFIQLRQVYLTVAGGHRVGIFGQTVMEGNTVVLMKQVQFLHIRIVHEVKGVAKEILPFLYEGGQILNFPIPGRISLPPIHNKNAGTIDS